MGPNAYLRYIAYALTSVRACLTCNSERFACGGVTSFDAHAAEKSNQRTARDTMHRSGQVRAQNSEILRLRLRSHVP